MAGLGERPSAGHPARTGRRRWWLWPVVLYLLLSSLYLVAVPVGESPDEPGHLQCLDQVARFQRLPVMEPKPSGEWWHPETVLSGRMCYHMPLYYVVGGFFYAIAARLQGVPLPVSFPPHNPDFGLTGAMFVHPPADTLWVTLDPAPIVWLRLVSIILGLVTLFAAGQVAQRFFPDRPGAPLLAMTLVAGWPQFLYLQRAVNNDIPATALAAGLLMVLLAGGAPRRYAWAGLLATLAIVTKFSMAFTVGVVVLAWAAEWWMLPALRRPLLRAGLVALLCWAGAAGLILLHPVLREHLAFTLGYWSGVRPQALSAGYWWDVVVFTASSGWARYGWMNIPAPLWQAALWWISLLAGAFLGSVTAWRHLAQTAGAERQRGYLAFWLVAIWALALLASYVRVNLAIFQPQFRFALALIPVVAGFAAGGFAFLLGASWRVERASLVVGLGLAGINLWLVISLLGPRF